MRTFRSNAGCDDALRTLAADGAAADALTAARRHVDRCPSCSGYLDDEGAAARALVALGPHRPARSWRLRRVVAVLSAAQLLIAVPWLFAWNPVDALAGHASAAHLARDGALGVFVGVAGLVAATLPRHALAVLVTAIAAVVMQALGFAVDEPANNVSLAYEALHLLVPLIITGVGLLVVRKDTTVAEPRRGPRLRIVR